MDYVEYIIGTTSDFLILIFNDNGLGIDLAKYKQSYWECTIPFSNIKIPEYEDYKQNSMKAMSGDLAVESKINIGTTFKIF